MTDAEQVSRALARTLATCAVRQVWAEQDEGPYHRGAQPFRRDVVEDREGVALQLGIRLATDDDMPLKNATVEIWQCDALGRYSGFPPPNSSGGVTAEGAPGVQYVADQSFLRGRQKSDAAGMVEFRTIYPGWYPGRTVHIHVMVHVDEIMFTSQLYFPDEVSEHVLSLMPYAERPGRDTTNGSDEIFPTGGDPAVLDTSPDGAVAAICLVLLSAGQTS